MLRRRSAITFRNLVMIALLGMALLGGGIYFGVNFAVDRAMKVDAEEKAADWAAYFISTMPGIDELVTSGKLSAEQLEVMATAEKLGDVFRFKLFDQKGGLVLVSDEIDDTSLAAEREHSAKAAEVLATGQSNISLNDGTGKENRPPLYVEAYVPMFGPDGEIEAVVEVYLDQTSTAALFRATFAMLAVGLAVVAALAFGLPTLAFLLRSRQASEAKQRADFLAHHDAMTGLLNRASFNAQLEAGLKADDDDRTVAVAAFDVDDFKTINERHGQEAGDEFLRHLARIITGSVDATDLAGRVGGDEFTVAFAGRGAAAVTEAVERVVLAARQPITVGGQSISGKISAGLHLIDAENADPADAIHKADVALYQAKIDGGNTYRLFSEDMETAIHARRALEQLIRDAAASDGFELHYQPLLHATTQRCAGFEALLRLPDGAGGYVPPVVFIPVAEAMGLISDIGRWVIERATKAAASWPDELFVSVNLSVKQFHDGRLVDHVKNALAASGLRPRQLEVEVTESMLMENTAQIATQLDALRAAGVSIAMDDFGTGYSSLGYLWQFGFDKLKIDRSFITALDVADNQARDILDTIIMLGHKLDMTVTAEGIETERQADVLRGLACDHFQGFFYGRPAPEGEIAAFLLANLKPKAASPSKARVAVAG